ncbi:MAG: peroxidase family protein [Rubrimonas sp.]|uniref:peroxidase family protein n=1 Tax=Rubrimonas sp. TaxID=2036015 RepID=UPI002FDC8BD7
MTPHRYPSSLPESLRTDARDAALPRQPPPGFRNMFHEHHADEADRWRGEGSAHDTEIMLAALAERMMARPPARRTAPFPAGYTYLAQFMAHDLQFSTDERIYPPAAVPHVALRKRRLTLETIYGEGPERDPQFYGAGDDALAPYRLRFGRFGPGVAPGQRTLARSAHCTSVSGAPEAPLCAADARNDENPVVAQVAGLFIRLHNVALRRLDRYGDPAERFAAARRVAQAAFRCVVFDDLLPRLLRPDVRLAYERGRRRDLPAARTDDVAVEFSHAVSRAGHALVRPDYAVSPTVNSGHAINVREMIRHTSRRDPEAFAQGRAWAVDWSLFFGARAQPAEPFAPHVNPFLAEAPGLLADALRPARRAHLPLRDLARGMDAGPLRVEALAEHVRADFAGVPGLHRWLAFDASHRGSAVLEVLGEDRALKPWRASLCAEPPLYLFALIEAAAPEDQGGGAGLRFGALGSIVTAEPLYAARDASRESVEDHPDLKVDAATVFGPAGAPAGMADLIEALIPARLAAS